MDFCKIPSNHWFSDAYLGLDHGGRSLSREAHTFLTPAISSSWINKPSHSSKEINFCCLYLQTHSFRHHPELMTIGDDRNVDWLLFWQFCFYAQLSFQYNISVQHPHYCGRRPYPSVKAPPHIIPWGTQSNNLSRSTETHVDLLDKLPHTLKYSWEDKELVRCSKTNPGALPLCSNHISDGWVIPFLPRLCFNDRRRDYRIEEVLKVFFPPPD